MPDGSNFPNRTMLRKVTACCPREKKFKRGGDEEAGDGGSEGKGVARGADLTKNKFIVHRL